MMNSYMGGYNQMGYGGMMNPGMNNQSMEAGPFRNVYGVIGNK